ncbi:MAG: pro-sigmaK processing inhibitor BofA family protein [Oscillospiraceae bacterium]|nr:pro-sigmaK processing inhibitor BofA family protein [Oscillospiraceae bacterium]
MQNWDTGIISGLNLAELIFYASGAICAIAVLVYYMKAAKPVRTALIGMLSGAAMLIAVHFFGEKIGLALPLNGVTVFVSLVLGAPGVAAMCLIQNFF